MSHFDPVFAETLGKEGGFVDNPHDKGGPTRWGITEAVARKYGYAGDMRDLPQPEARRIGKLEFWDPMNLDAVAALSPPIARELFDTSFNGGGPVAPRMLQRALKCLNRSHRTPPDYPEVNVDGNIGPKTVEALKAFLDKRGRDGLVVMIRLLNGQQRVRFMELCENRERNEEFLFGWTLHRTADEL